MASRGQKQASGRPSSRGRARGEPSWGSQGERGLREPGNSRAEPRLVGRAEPSQNPRQWNSTEAVRETGAGAEQPGLQGEEKMLVEIQSTTRAT